MIMFCNTCGSLLLPKLQDVLIMNCFKCNTTYPPNCNILSFTNYEQVNTSLSKQELIDLVSSNTLPISKSKSHCKNKDVVFYESNPSDSIKTNSKGFGIKYVCLGCYTYL